MILSVTRTPRLSQVGPLVFSDGHTCTLTVRSVVVVLLSSPVSVLASTVPCNLVAVVVGDTLEATTNSDPEK